MLNIGKLSAGAAEYYIGEVATAAEDYYSGRGEAALLRSGRTPLRPVFAGPHLVVYELPHATPILTGPPGARVVSLAESRIVVAARRK